MLNRIDAEELSARIEEVCQDLTCHSLTADVMVFHADITTMNECSCAHLPSEEQRRAASFLRPADRDRFVLGRSSIRRIYSLLLNIAPEQIPITIDRYGKPHIDHPLVDTICWNIAHSGPHVVGIVSSRHPCGIDVEEIRPLPDWKALCEHVLSSQDALWPCNNIQTLLRAWTAKEAFAKMTGRGLSLLLHDIHLFDDEAQWNAIRARLAWLPICSNAIVCTAISHYPSSNSGFYSNTPVIVES